ncbi:ABC-type transport system involved in cytochrome c biogenesis, permease component [Prosthecobacter debontii]|uniref:ABC-type transport system involved in cytochrome c biogenesis, permease component n=1 Tax=Prosthecobacter debontii TaxID=48467 RepID=A0A1T4YET2_9BACT|nr:cytochrome c biogenesis protein CcsA [Prosthecobacter debontii]SKB00264.1 ABC-type transport system involved in cytochrome c biogenesis, permease component [Prosthecobacter debontii]
MKHFLCFLLLMTGLLQAHAQQQPDPAILRDPEIIKTFQSLPVQEGGRVKPLDTYARYLLLRLHGKQSISVDHPSLPGVTKLKATEWLLLTWFRPDIARDLPLFVVDNSQAVGEIGVDPKGLRDRYSWNEIVKGKEELVKRAQAYSEIPNDSRTGVQRNVIDLARNFFDFDAVSDFLTAARTDWKKEIAAILPPEASKDFTDAATLSVWDVAEKLGVLIRDHKLEALGQETSNKLLELFINTTLRPGKTLAFLPPDDLKNDTWMTVEQTITNLMRDGSLSEGDLRRSKGKDALYAASLNADTFKTAAKTFVDDVRTQAEKRGELKHVDREVSYYKADYFTYALVWYLLGFLVSFVGLVAPQTSWARWTARIAWVTLILALSYNVWGIVQRCIINERAPIATLYETIIFITASIGLVGLFVERVTRQGIGLVVTGFVGALGMFLSNRFMALDGQDTMPTLEAVLITNFWLATHVTCINIGYAGAMLGSIMSMVYVIYRLVARGDDVANVRRLITRITYGIVCFGLLFALVGTVLGGIWANDSWGRFWGWDPKENGALMIVLMGLIILHARLGGYIREIGLHALSLVLGAVTLFSWFGVNQLSIGLHSYGFTDGITLALNTGYSIKAIFILACLAFWWQERAEKKRAAA